MDGPRAHRRSAIRLAVDGDGVPGSRLRAIDEGFSSREIFVGAVRHEHAFLDFKPDLLQIALIALEGDGGRCGNFDHRAQHVELAVLEVRLFHVVRLGSIEQLRGAAAGREDQQGG
jgi:hypothetical protein